MRVFVRFWCVVALVVLSAPHSYAQNTQAITFAAQGNWSQAQAAAKRSQDPVVRDLYRWLAYTKGAPQNDYRAMKRFVDQNSDWPSLVKIKLEAEKLQPSTMSDQDVLSWFRSSTPLTVDGVDRYARALIKSGKTTALRRMLSGWWPSAKLTREQQKEFYTRYNRYLNRSANIERFNKQLYSKRYSNAEGMATVLGSGYPALMRARKALATQSPDAGQLVNLVSSKFQSDAGLLYERLRWRRRNNLDRGAIEILDRSPNTSAMHSPKEWWRERHILARRFIERKQYKRAYNLVRRHKQKEGFARAQAEWLSGWLALRFVNKPWEAFEHFEKLYKNVKSPISKARGAYWSGRASDALKHGEIASEWYQVAASYPHTFYGQLAMAQMGRLQSIKASTAPTVSEAKKSSFNQKGLVKAVKILQRLGLKEEAEVFMARLLKNSKTTSDYILVSNLAKNSKLEHLSIRAAQALEKEKGVRTDTLLYPTLHSSVMSSAKIESGFVQAIIRQESRFDSRAISHAGARGYMQLMPATAKQVARQSGLSHQQSWLTSKPRHNVALGSRYLKQMRDRFDGSYAMAAAAYNGGPGRVDRWIKEFGDPRRGQVDLIDWIELIPIYETRNYVQRVLEAVFVYRSLLGETQTQTTPIHTAYKSTAN